MSLSEGTVPNDWLFANVIPVHKSKEKNLATNYRPISLLSIISKVAERCIYNHVYPNIVTLLHPSQHGFLSGKSTSTQLVQFLMEVGDSLDNSCQSDVIYTDFAKAFDTVSHELLLQKMCKMGFNGSLMKWFTSYLSNRHQRVIIDGVASGWVKVTSGVPQGSILGPLLFLIFINDLPDVLNCCQPLLFADDAKIFLKVQSIYDCNRIQTDLNSLNDWCVKNNLNLNVSKCKVLCLTRSHSPIHFNYCINGESVERVTEIKDLGVIIDNTLSWNKHVNTTVAKANQALGLIKRTVGFNAPDNVKLQLFKSLVRSKLEYCSQAWNGLTIKNRVKLERVQRAATRYILNFPDNMSYTERLSKTNLLPLSYRRDVLDLKFFYKCLHGQNSLNINVFVNFTSNNIVATRSASDPSLLKPPYCKTTAFQNAYFNRISYSWNSLPLYIRNASTIESFSRQLKKHLYPKIASFNPECCCCLYYKCNCPNRT